MIEKKFIWIAIDVIIIATLFIILVLSGVTLNTKELKTEYLDELEQNWKQKPIMDIQLKTARGPCPAEYETLVFDQWPGTSEGCNCQGATTGDKDDDDDDHHDDDHDRRLRHLDDDDDDNDDDDDDRYEDRGIYKGKCRDKQIRRGCVPILANQKVNITYWDGVELCVKQSFLPQDYKTYVQNADDDKRCEKGYRSCGQLDSLKQVLCLPITEDCPINSIYLTTSRNPPSLTRSFTTIPLTNYYLHISNTDDNGSIIVSFKLSERSICINPKEVNMNYKPYVLEGNIKNYQCSTVLGKEAYDTRYNLLSSTTKQDIYSKNNILAAVQSLPDYPIGNLDQSINLYYRNYIGCDKDCFEEDDDDHHYVMPNSREAKRYYNIGKGFHIATFVFILISFGFFCLVLIYKCCKKFEKTVSTKVCEGMLVFLTVIIFILSVTSYCLCKKVNRYALDCEETITELWFDDMLKDIRRNKRMHCAIFILALLIILLHIAICLFNRFCTEKETTVVTIQPKKTPTKRTDTQEYELSPKGKDIGETPIEEKYNIELPVVEQKSDDRDNVFSLNNNTPNKDSIGNTPNTPNDDKNFDIKSKKSNAPAAGLPDQMHGGIIIPPFKKEDTLIDESNTTYKKKDDSIVMKKPSDSQL